MHEFTADRGHHGLPPLGADKLGHLFRAFLFGPLAAMTNHYPTRLDDVEITALEMARRGEFPDRNVVFLIKLDRGGIVRAAAFELHMTDQRPPGRHGRTVAGKKIAVQHLVAVQVMTGHAVFFVDRDHLGMLRHRLLQIELDAGLVRIGQRTPDQRPRLDPFEILGTAQQNIRQLGIIVVDAPVLRERAVQTHLVPFLTWASSSNPSVA